MAESEYELIFETRNRSGDHSAGRGEVNNRCALVFSVGETRVDVAEFEEYDKRPFYDAWELQEVKDASLYAPGPESELIIRVRIEIDMEWGTGGPMIDGKYFQSQDRGATWKKIPYIDPPDKLEKMTPLTVISRSE